MGAGTGKMKISGAIGKQMKDSFIRAFDYLKSIKAQVGVGSDILIHDFNVEAIDLLGSAVDAPSGIALFVGLLSALKKQSVLPAVIILGDLAVREYEQVNSLSEPLQDGSDNDSQRNGLYR